MQAEEAYKKFWREIGESQTMVLASSFQDSVSARTMSVIILDGKLYFQTDRTFRKYEQIKCNARVALCGGNIQIEGLCRELGKPTDCAPFLRAYQTHFPDSYRLYSLLENERLFVVEPTFAERWLYLDGAPFVETFDFIAQTHRLARYEGSL